MKKLLSLLLMLALVSTMVTVSANSLFFVSKDGSMHGHVSGIAELGELTDEEEDYNLYIDTNSVITFEVPLDALYIYEVVVGEKGGDVCFVFDNAEKNNGSACSVNYTTSVRNDSIGRIDQNVDLDNEVEYMNENTTIRFNKTGTYSINAIRGAKDGYERVSNLIEDNFEGKIYYSEPNIFFNITVSEETQAGELVEPEYYDKKVLSISGITEMSYDRNVMNDPVVALCVSPTVITAQTDLSNIGISKIEEINGVWTETKFIDGYGISQPDPENHWMPTMGFEDVEDGVIIDGEFIADGDIIFEEVITDDMMGVKKGTSFAITEPGMYTVWADSVNGDFTGLTFEVRDSHATYTSSKVLVDGKEIKFEAYNINGNNYFKLRDIAYALSNSQKQGVFFNVKWDGERNMINLVSHEKYDAVGGELKEGDGTDKSFTISSSALLKDGMKATLNAYNINGNNYFKLRDLGKLIGFNVGWDGANNCIIIDSTMSYME